MQRNFAILGSISGCVSVAAGAFGAHALQARLEQDALRIFETAARYQMYHAPALLAAAWCAAQHAGAAARGAGWCFVAGTVLFSGSLYALALGGNRLLGAVTPIGGSAFLLGWVLLAWSFRNFPAGFRQPDSRG